MARTIKIDASILFDVLELIDERSAELREFAEQLEVADADVAELDIERAEEWEADASTIREALGIEIDDHDNIS